MIRLYLFKSTLVSRMLKNRHKQRDVNDNSEDFDWALVLKPDDEYRQAVAALQRISGFSEMVEGMGSNLPFNFTNQNDFTRFYNPVEVKTVPSFDVINEAEYEDKIITLQRQKKDFAREARRSSEGFLGRFVTDDDSALENFTSLLSKGVYVTRHRANNESEIIKISTSSENPGEIQWCREKVEPIQEDTPSISLQAFSNEGEVVPSLTKQTSKPVRPYTSYFSLDFAFRSHGKFQQSDIMRVHPATSEDPTWLGVYGTEALRRSLDVFNEQLTFSLVLQKSGKKDHFYTLDLECETFELYVVLLRGFMILYKQTRESRIREAQSPVRSRATSVFSANNKKAALGVSDFQKWLNMPPARDPIHSLFDARNDRGASAPSSPKRSPVRAAVNQDLERGELDENVNDQSFLIDHSADRTTSALSSEDIPPAQFLGWKAAGTQIWARLTMAGCDVKCMFSWDLSRVLMKVKCPQWRLEEVAEQLGMRFKNRQGHLRRFKVSRRDMFRQDEDGIGPLFLPSERQQIMEHILFSKIKDGGAELDEGTELGKFIEQRFPLHKYDRLLKLQHTWVSFWKREPFGVVPKPWSPLSVPVTYTVKSVYYSSTHFFGNLLNQPLQEIAEYFGETIAFYFAFLAFYTKWLTFPAFIGFIVFCIQYRQNQLDSIWCLPYALLLMIWATYMLVEWRREAARLAFEWNVLNYEVEEHQRPQFIGTFTYDESTDEFRKEYPFWKRVLRYSVTIPICVGIMAAMIYIMAAISTAQDAMYFSYMADHHSITVTTGGNSTAAGSHSTTQVLSTVSNSDLANSQFWLVEFLIPGLYALFVDVACKLFNIFADSLNKFENHRTQNTFINRYIIKVFAFRVLVVFTPLFYFAYAADPNFEAPYLRIAVYLFSFLTVGQWWSIVLDVYAPAWYNRFLIYFIGTKVQEIKRNIYEARESEERKAKAASCYVDAEGNVTHASDSARMLEEGNLAAALDVIQRREMYLNECLSSPWKQAMMLPYHVLTDYTLIVVQLGLILLFSLVFPLAPLIALVNNLCLIRMGAHKLCTSRQRPVARKTGSIGVWEDVLQLISIAGIINSCAVLGITSDQLRHSLQAAGTTIVAVLLFVIEHVMLLFKYFLHAVMPKIPNKVLRAQAKNHRMSKGDDGGGPEGRTGRRYRNTMLLNQHLNRPKKPPKPPAEFRSRANTPLSALREDSIRGHKGEFGLDPDEFDDKENYRESNHRNVYSSRRGQEEEEDMDNGLEAKVEEGDDDEYLPSHSIKSLRESDGGDSIPDPVSAKSSTVQTVKKRFNRHGSMVVEADRIEAYQTAFLSGLKPSEIQSKYESSSESDNSDDEFERKLINTSRSAVKTSRSVHVVTATARSGISGTNTARSGAASTARTVQSGTQTVRQATTPVKSAIDSSPRSKTQPQSNECTPVTPVVPPITTTGAISSPAISPKPPKPAVPRHFSLKMVPAEASTKQPDQPLRMGSPQKPPRPGKTPLASPIKPVRSPVIEPVVAVTSGLTSSENLGQPSVSTQPSVPVRPAPEPSPVTSTPPIVQTTPVQKVSKVGEWMQAKRAGVSPVSTSVSPVTPAVSSSVPAATHIEASASVQATVPSSPSRASPSKMQVPKLDLSPSGLSPNRSPSKVAEWNNMKKANHASSASVSPVSPAPAAAPLSLSSSPVAKPVADSSPKMSKVAEWNMKKNMSKSPLALASTASVPSSPVPQVSTSNAVDSSASKSQSAVALSEPLPKSDENDENVAASSAMNRRDIIASPGGVGNLGTNTHFSKIRSMWEKRESAGAMPETSSVDQNADTVESV